jgi:cell wall-associated NlpC family hydrolase
MSVAEVQARISEIQGQLALLAPARGAGSAAAFATALRTGGAPAAGGPLFGDSASVQGLLLGEAPSLGDAGAPTTGTTTGADVVAEARRYLGVPYVWGGTDPAKGLDCSGLVQLVYRNLGYELPRVSYQQATAGRAVTGGLAQAQPGDILAFNSPVNHVGIYIGGGKMIEAPRTGLDVRVIDVYETPTAIRRVLPESAAAGATGVPGVGPAARTSVPPGTPFGQLFEAAAARYGVDAGLLVAVARQESGFNPGAVSPAGAQGLMQLMPGTARGLGVTNSFDPAQAVDGATRLLRSLLTDFGRTDLALAAYNAGPGAVRKYGGIPPYPETQNYVRSIMAALQRG